ncbi:MAG: hypothetical protein U0235_28910 [Polyangiaceae bacterium]
MLGAAHFFALVVLSLAVGRALRRHFSSPPPSRVVAAIAWGGAVVLVGLMQLHACDEGQPIAQWVIPAASATAAVLFVGHKAVRRALAIFAILTAFVLSFSFTAAVHGPTYTGNPGALRDRPAPRAEWHTMLTGLYRKP